jgi:hypothetical protein
VGSLVPAAFARSNLRDRESWNTWRPRRLSVGSNHWRNAVKTSPRWMLWRYRYSALGCTEPPCLRGSGGASGGEPLPVSPTMFAVESTVAGLAHRSVSHQVRAVRHRATVGRGAEHLLGIRVVVRPLLRLATTLACLRRSRAAIAQQALMYAHVADVSGLPARRILSSGRGLRPMRVTVPVVVGVVRLAEPATVVGAIAPLHRAAVPTIVDLPDRSAFTGAAGFGPPPVVGGAPPASAGRLIATLNRASAGSLHG